MNLVLIQVNQRLVYYQDFIELVAQSMERSFEPYWFVLRVNK